MAAEATTEPAFREAVRAAIEAIGAVNDAVVLVDADDRALARADAGLRATAAADVPSGWQGYVLGSSLAAPDAGTALAALRERAADYAVLVAIVRNAAFVERRLMALDPLGALPVDEAALSFAGARDRLEAAGFLVTQVRRVRRAPAHWPRFGAAATSELTRLLAGDPDATVEWYALVAVPTTEAAQLSELRRALAAAEQHAAQARTRATELAEAANAAERADIDRRVRSAGEECAAVREALHATRAEVERLESMVRELEALRERAAAECVAADRQAATATAEVAAAHQEAKRRQQELAAAVARAAESEAALGLLQSAAAVRAAQRWWRLKARIRGR